MSTDPHIEEPSCLAFSRQDIRAGKASPVIRGLVDIIDSQKRRLDALAAADKAATITTRAQMEALPDGSVFIDSSGDIGTVHTARVWYPETSPISLTYAARYLPARVIHRGAE